MSLARYSAKFTNFPELDLGLLDDAAPDFHVADAPLWHVDHAVATSLLLPLDLPAHKNQHRLKSPNLRRMPQQKSLAEHVLRQQDPLCDTDFFLERWSTSMVPWQLSGCKQVKSAEGEMLRNNTLSIKMFNSRLLYAYACKSAQM